MKPKSVVFDIDSTILDSEFIIREIHKLGLKGEEKWDYFYENCNSDRVKVIAETKKFIETIDNSLCYIKKSYIDGFESYKMIEQGKFVIIFSTARNEKCRTATEDKLWDEGIRWDYLYMRKQSDLRSACEVKREHLLKIMEEFDIVAFIDDDLENCEMAKGLGILSLRRV